MFFKLFTPSTDETLAFGFTFVPTTANTPQCIQTHRMRRGPKLVSGKVTRCALDRLPLITVPTELDLPTPGETCQVTLHHSILQHMLTTRGQDFVLSAERLLDQPDSRGVLLSVLKVKPPSEPTDQLSAECRCPSRTRLEDIATAVQSSLPFPVTRAVPVHDVLAESHSERVALAQAEWRVWLDVLETFRLSRRLASVESSTEENSQRVRVWAPKHYDRLITLEEWKNTPLVTRQIWCRRAESFSFAVLRSMDATPQQLQQAMRIENTSERFHIAADCIETAQARIYAQLSLKDVLG